MFSIDSTKKYKEAIDGYKVILETKPDDTSALNNVGLAYHILGDTQESISWYDKALSVNPAHTQALFNKSRSLIDVERYEEALACLDRLTNELGQVKDSEIWLEKGLTLVELSRNEEALECLDKCLNFGENAYAYLNKAHALIGLSKFNQALENADKALAKNSDRPIFWAVKGRVLYHLGRYKSALETLDRATSFDVPAPACAWLYKALTFEKLGDNESAMNSFQKDLKSPKCPV